MLFLLIRISFLWRQSITASDLVLRFVALILSNFKLIIMVKSLCSFEIEQLEIFCCDNFYLAPKLYITQNKLFYFTSSFVLLGLLRKNSKSLECIHFKHLILLDDPQTNKITCTTFKNHFKTTYKCQWPHGLMDKASDFGSEHCEFESRRGRYFLQHLKTKVIDSLHTNEVPCTRIPPPLPVIVLHLIRSFTKSTKNWKLIRSFVMISYTKSLLLNKKKYTT